MGNTVGPQSTSAPCVIAGTQCQQPAGFGFNNFTSSGAISSYNMFSTTPTATVADGVQGTPYTVGQIRAAGFNAVRCCDRRQHDSRGGETLQLFEVIVNGVVAYNYVGPTLIGNVANNGNGFGDWSLGAIDLSGFAAPQRSSSMRYGTMRATGLSRSSSVGTGSARRRGSARLGDGLRRSYRLRATPSSAIGIICCHHSLHRYKNSSERAGSLRQHALAFGNAQARVIP